MNILLTTVKAPDSVYFPTNEKLFPLGLASLASVIRNAGHDVVFHDPYYNPSEIPTIEDLKDVDVVGIYVCTICYQEFIKMVEGIRNAGYKGKIIAGGPHWSMPTDYPEIIESHNISHCVEGEAENWIVDIIEGEYNAPLLKSQPIEYLDLLPRPAYDLIGSRDYRCHDKTATNPVFNMNTSRGCPYNCSFCSSPPISGRKYRCQSAERIIDDILWLKSDYNVGSIYFRENNFCVSKKRTIEFCETILKRNVDVEWRCEATVKDLPREILILMKKTGCKGIFVGFETGSKRLLPLLKPGFSIEDNIEVAENCRELEMPLHASFLVGTPYEIDEDEKETLDFIEKYIPKGQACINVYIGLHGSKIYNELDESGNYCFKDKMGLIYTHGHDERIRKYFKIDSPNHKLLIPKRSER